MIVFPMVGKSSRFSKAGYSLPKYMLKVGAKTVFERVLDGFSNQFNSEVFLFVVREDHNNTEFIKLILKKLCIDTYFIVSIDGDTAGQADTVRLGLEKIAVSDDERLVIFNIDTFRNKYAYPENLLACDGYLEVFKGEGDNWSFVKPKGDKRVSSVEEKNPISNLCSTGLYYFKSKYLYLYAYNKFIETPKSEWVNGEVYIAPLYNVLITDGYDICFDLINSDEVEFCGVPAEYEYMVRKVNQDDGV